MDLTPRPTTYKGIQMRSRLEARYAASFDRGHFAWTYEPQCFANDGGQYLPDFELHDVEVAHAFTPGWLDPFMPPRVRSIYVEVKPPGHDLAAVCQRMEIILDSDADAGLLLLSEEYAREGDPGSSDGLILMPAIGGSSMWIQAWLMTRTGKDGPAPGVIVVGFWTYFRLSGFRLAGEAEPLSTGDPECAA